MNSPLQLTIFHTNDVHGRLEALARLASLLRREWAAAEAEGRMVFYWDAGDTADRRFEIFSLTKGAAIAPILNAMRCSLQTMGNAIALPYGPQSMAEVARRADYPILAANCRNGVGPLVEGLRESARFSLPGGLTLGVFGLTAPWGNFYQVFGLYLPDTLATAQRVVEELRAGGAAAIVMLSHLGLEDDRRVVESVPGIDLIIGGHSHSRLEKGELANGVLIAQAGEYAGYLGRVDLSLDPSSGAVLAKSARLLPVPADEPTDPAVLAAIQQAEEEVTQIKSRVVAELVEPLELEPFAECGIGSMTADAMRERMGADAALIASGLFHDQLPAGKLTIGDLNRACFSSANPGVTEMSGEQLVQALERGLDPAIIHAEPGGYRGSQVGIPQISGMRVWYDPEARVGERIQRVEVGGEPLQPGRRYRIAHTDAEAMDNFGYIQRQAGQSTQYEVPTIVREAIEDYLRSHSPYTPPEAGRWVAV